MQFSTFVLAALSVGSAIAGPVAGFVPFNNAASKVAEVKVLVQQEAANINSATSGSPNAKTVADVQKSLLTIGRGMNGLIDPVNALASVGPTSLTKEQIAAVPQFQKDFQTIFVNLEGIGKRISNSNLDKAAISQVKPELQWVLSSPATISRPVIAFVDAAAPKYATYSYWYPSLINIEALIVVFLGPIAIGLGIGISIL
ncbi:hypothetical protein F5B22DRAFT_559463 [Xylaria bambusicola]|uniref:uncharacterized protein n=1 Tax=Xylaria bambusicola TaxID=326684 RepID=UPI0020073CB4|nr:uncharacterized protein F5B22DRAFT_559463 [Xylaria bambusicola]KAI0503260.1 hypothetical protein F5B22DRAFT_559463 [Xylaria bambusicola]